MAPYALNSAEDDERAVCRTGLAKVMAGAPKAVGGLKAEIEGNTAIKKWQVGEIKHVLLRWKLQVIHFRIV